MIASKYYICWILICHFLDYDTILKLKDLDHVIDSALENDLIWKYTEETFNFNHNRLMIYYIKQLNKYINVATIKISTYDICFNKHKDIFRFLYKFKNLTSLNLEIRLMNIDILFDHFNFSKLKHFKILINGSSRYYSYDKTRILNAPSLESLKIENTDIFISNVFVLPSLKSLGIRKIKDYGIIKENNIEKLSIRDKVTDEFFDHIHKFKNLNTLAIEISPTDKFFNYLSKLDKNSTLTSLSLKIHDVKIQDISKYFSKCQHLKDLDIFIYGNEYDIDEETLNEFKHLSHLDKLIIYVYNNYRDHRYMKFKSKNLVIKLFDITKNIKICDVSIGYEDHCNYVYNLPYMDSYKKLDYPQLYQKIEEFTQLMRLQPQFTSKYRISPLYFYGYYLERLCTSALEKYKRDEEQKLKKLIDECFKLSRTL
jgi:hypothetical protein